MSVFPFLFSITRTSHRLHYLRYVLCCFPPPEKLIILFNNALWSQCIIDGKVPNREDGAGFLTTQLLIFKEKKVRLLVEIWLKRSRLLACFKISKVINMFIESRYTVTHMSHINLLFKSLWPWLPNFFASVCLFIFLLLKLFQARHHGWTQPPSS